MITVTLFYRDHCPECDQALADLKSLEAEIPYQLTLVNVDKDSKIQNLDGIPLPLVEIGPYHLKPPFTRQDLKIMLSAARDRRDQMERVDQSTELADVEMKAKLSTGDRLTQFFSKHYLATVNILLFVFVGLPFLAPVLEKSGYKLPAIAIYRFYGTLCHQLAFRSWFLFGEQAYYPRELAGIEGVITYEELADTHEIDLFAARDFTGNPVTGYKVALCERDVAIYLFMLLFGLAFWASGRRIKSIPWYLWVILGLGPMGLDGFSQLPSLAAGLPDWLPLRESTPLMRTLTGGMFGWMTAWYLFPMLEESAREAGHIVEHKLAVIRRANQQAH
jgi:uncharacterized membrane protein